MDIVLTVVIVFALLLVNEWWWRSRRVHDEINRKFIHLTVGSFVAFWPLFLSWDAIRWLSLAFLVVVALSRYLGIFKAIHSVSRPTWGEIFFAAAVGAITFITQSKGVYAVALLQMSLADGLAAVAGTGYGKPYAYKVLGNTKSLVGSGTFLLVSYLLFLGFSVYSNAFGVIISLAAAAVATLVENAAIRGLDNLLVPVLAALVMEAFL